MKRAALVALVLVASACGYRPVYGGAAEEHFRVALGSCLVPEPVACDEVLSGMRERFAQEGALTTDASAPRVVVEVLRSDEGAEALSAPPATGSDRAPPVARAIALGLVVRGWLERTPGGAKERDTGDLRALDVIDPSGAPGAGDPRAATLQAEDTLRAVGRRLGQRVALRILGFPVTADETAGVDR